jgi:hypothetical protein
MSDLLKAEKLLREALYCFNEIPNKKISDPKIKDTYHLAYKIDAYFKEKVKTEDRQPEN